MDKYEKEKYVITPKYSAPVKPKEIRVSDLNSLGMYEFETGYYYIPKFKIEELLESEEIELKKSI
jgi:hypothetical protein